MVYQELEPPDSELATCSQAILQPSISEDETDMEDLDWLEAMTCWCAVLINKYALTFCIFCLANFSFINRVEYKWIWQKKKSISSNKQSKFINYIDSKTARQQVEYILDRKLTDKSWQAYVTSESRKLKSTKRPKEKSKPQFTFVDVAKHAAKKDKGAIYWTKTMSTEQQNFSEKIKIITRLRSCGNTIIANWVQWDLSTKFMEM